MRNCFVIVLMLFNLSQSYGQNNTRLIKHIEQLVAATNTDSTITKIVVEGTPEDNDDEQNSRQQITVFFKGSKISKISLCDSRRGRNPLMMSDGGNFTDYYLENEELCFVNELNVDNSRPGSCGYVNIANKFYFNNRKLIKHLKQGYNPCDAFAKANRDPTPESVLQSFKSLFEIAKSKKPIANYPQLGTTVFQHYFVVACPGVSDKNCTETEVLQTDSIAKMKDDFQKLISFIKEENANPEIDTISKYKLKFIVESQKSDYIAGGATQGNFLKKCDQEIDLKKILLYQARSYSNRYMVTEGFPTIIEIGNSYTTSSFMRYYFEKTE